MIEFVKARPLSKIKTNIGAARLIFFDIETKNINKEENKTTIAFNLCTAVLSCINKEGRQTRYKEFHTWEQLEFFSWFENILVKKRNTLCISSNIWFDLRTSGLLNYLIMSGFTVKIFYTKGLTNIISLEKDQKKVTFLNIQQLIPGSVKSYGKLLNLPKLKIDFDKDSKETLLVYCKRDTEIIYKIFLNWYYFIQEHELGRLKYTLPSQSLTAFRKNFLTHDIMIHGNELYSDMEKETYFGGRTEIFYYGKLNQGKITCVDVNSMYPYVMEKHKMPYELRKVLWEPDIKALKHYIKRNFVLAKVKLNTDKNWYPKKLEGKLCFPIGTFTTALCKPELELALKHNHIVSIEYLMVYKEDYIFKEFVKFFHKLKTEYTNSKNMVYRQMVKIMMNSLYGKFAQMMDTIIWEKNVEEIKYGTEYLVDIDSNERYKTTQLGDRVRLYKEGGKYARHSLVPVSACVTSYARIHLLSLMRACGDKNYFYCDTDSLFVNHEGLKNLSGFINPDKLGFLGIEKESKNVTIYAPKDYIFGKSRRMKGVTQNATRNLDGSYNTTVFPSMLSDLSNGMDSEYKLIHMKKKMKRQYTKGIVQNSGFVKPFVLKDDELQN